MSSFLFSILLCLSASSERLLQQHDSTSYPSDSASHGLRNLLASNTTEACDLKIEGLENQDIYTDKEHPESSLDLGGYIKGSTTDVVFNVSKDGQEPAWIRVDNVHQALLFYATSKQQGANSLLLTAQEGRCLDTAKFTVNVHYKYDMWERISENVLAGVLVTLSCSALLTVAGSACYCAKRFGRCCWHNPMQTPCGLVVCCLRSKCRLCNAVGFCFECKSCYSVRSALCRRDGIIISYNPWNVEFLYDYIERINYDQGVQIELTTMHTDREGATA